MRAVLILATCIVIGASTWLLLAGGGQSTGRMSALRNAASDRPPASELPEATPLPPPPRPISTSPPSPAQDAAPDAPPATAPAEQRPDSAWIDILSRRVEKMGFSKQQIAEATSTAEKATLFVDNVNAIFTEMERADFDLNNEESRRMAKLIKDPGFRSGRVPVTTGEARLKAGIGMTRPMEIGSAEGTFVVDAADLPVDDQLVLVRRRHAERQAEAHRKLSELIYALTSK